VAEVVDVPDDEIEIGMRLRVDFNQVDDDLTLPIWRLDTPRPSAARRPKESG
jgi:uncharacterized protein